MDSSIFAAIGYRKLSMFIFGPYTYIHTHFWNLSSYLCRLPSKFCAWLDKNLYWHFLSWDTLSWQYYIWEAHIVAKNLGAESKEQEWLNSQNIFIG